MSLKNFLLILCVLAVSFSFVSAQSQNCGDSPFFRPNGTYDKNRRLLLSSLASNVSSQDGFYNVLVGEGSGRIYMLGLCLPGTDPKVCSDCIETTSAGLLQNCLFQTDSWDWKVVDDTVCFVRYSNYSFFDHIELDSTQEDFKNSNVSGNNRTWVDFMARLISATSFSTPGSLAGRHYAVNITSLSSFQSIYAMMQCIPGISSVDCEACLQANVRDFQSCCGGYNGGTIRRPVCYFQFNPYPFYGAFDNITTSPSSQSSQDPQPTASPPPDGKTISTEIIAAIVASAVIFVALLALGLLFLKRRLSYKKLNIETNDDITSQQSLQFDFKMIEAATNKFSANNKVGQGGFGEVFMGILPNGTEIAVKRLSRNSGQGTQEFKNEVVIVAKLQHKNLVRLIGFCLERDEQILIYEFVPNKSLDYFLFDPAKKDQLDWERRYNIIGGITRGLLYLHQDSRLTIIHRDIKESNILLDVDMNPKIADFGMARNFRIDQTEDQTGRVVGTFGYMPPEYVTNGQFSTKSDVYSFGVLILEIVCGKKNSSFCQMNDSGGNLVTHVWRLWINNCPLDLIGPAITESYNNDEVIRCIHIGLLCVQETPVDRPSMATIFQMLTNSSITLPVPRPPGFIFQDRRSLKPVTYGSENGQSSSKSIPCSIDTGTVTSVTPR